MIQYELEFHHNQQLLISRVKGEMLPDETAQMGLKARTKAKELDYKLILDFRDTTNQITMIDSHLWFKRYYNELDPDLRMVKTVLLYDLKDKELFDFVELSWENQGIMTRVMTDEKEAIQWLTSL